MNQMFEIAMFLCMLSMTVALISLKKEYEQFRKDVISILGGLGLIVRSKGQGMTIHVMENIKHVKE